MTAVLHAPRIGDIPRDSELEEQLRKVGAFLESEGLAGLFGVELVHAHDKFVPGEGEALLEITVGDSQRTQIVPDSMVTPDQAAAWWFIGGVPVVSRWCQDSGDGNH